MRSARLLLWLAAALTACASPAPSTPAAPPRAERYQPPAVEGLTLQAAYVLPRGMVVDAYGARRTGSYLAFGFSRRGPAPSRSRNPEWAFLDVRTGELTLVRAATAGATVNAIAGAGDWLLVREKRQEPGRCGASEDCYSWALYAYHLPSPRAKLLARSAQPGTELDAPEPGGEGDTFGWLEREAPGLFTVKRWSTADEAPGAVGQVKDEDFSPYLSVDGERLWLDDRLGGEGASGLRALGGAPAAVRFARKVFSPAVRGGRVAFVQSNPDFPDEVAGAALGHVDEATGEVRLDATLPSPEGVWDVSWLDERHLVVDTEESLDVYDARQPAQPAARLAPERVSATHVADGALVLVTRHPSGADAVWSLSR